VDVSRCAERSEAPYILVERVAAVLEVKLDDLFCEAGRLPPDLRGDIKAVVTLYRRSRDARNSNSK
jgi:HTH-type transcriptional regulator, competence development regulator